ncbi:MAG: MFS transporter [Steroidobacteraceae bacterium]
MSTTFGPVHLQPGVRTGNVLTLLYAAFIAVGLMTFLKTMQPYLFNVTLQVPIAAQGTVSGWLEVLAELVIIASIGAFGALADRIGRRPVFSLGFLLLAIGYTLLPLAHSVPEFAMYRVVFALGASATGAMLATVLVDYPRDRSRESLTALVYVMNGLGVVLFAIVLAKLPTWIQAAGGSPLWAGRCTLFTVGAIGLVSAVVMRGLKPGTPMQKPAREPLLALMKQGFAAARNPRVALAYGTAFASRGDIAVVGTFLTLWATVASMQSGADEATAAARTGALMAIVQSAALLWAGVFAWISSRLDRVTALILAMVLAVVGYTAFALVDDPNSSDALVAAVLLGIGQMSAILSSQVLIGQEAPRETIGSVLGVYGFFGAIGILFVSVAGGMLFDSWWPGSPFMIMAAANSVLLIWALAVRRIVPGPLRDRAVVRS